MKTIAVDIDEVLAHHYRMLAKFHNEHYGTSHVESDYFTEYWSQVWNVHPDEASRRAIEFHESGAHASLEPIGGALTILKELKENYRLVVVTVRRKLIVELTKEWIATHYPGVFDEIRFVHMWEDEADKTKAEICQEVGADWLIDDSVKHTTAMSESGKVGLLFGDYAWNKAEALPARVHRLKDWQDVKEYFKNERS